MEVGIAMFSSCQRYLFFCLVILQALGVSAGQEAQYPTPCQPGWSALTHDSGNGVNGLVYALAVYENATEHSLYAGGQVYDADPAVALLTRWNGSQMEEILGPSSLHVNGNVFRLISFNDGSGESLFVAGRFTTLDQVEYNNIARWDGSSFHTLSGSSKVGVSRAVSSLMPFDDGSGVALYVGQNDTVARWNGYEWTLPSAKNAEEVHNLGVTSMVVFNDGTGEALYTNGVGDTGGVARWDGTAWTVIPTPLSCGMCYFFVTALGIFDDGHGEALYAGISFHSPPFGSSSTLMRKEDDGWKVIGSPVSESGCSANCAIYTFARHDGSRGSSLSVGGPYVAQWNGASFVRLPTITPQWESESSPIWALALFDDGDGAELYAAGAFAAAGGVPASNIAKWPCVSRLVFQDDFEFGGPAFWTQGSTGSAQSDE